MLKKGDIVKFKDGRSIYILGPKGDGYDYKDGREKGHHPKGWFDMMISSGKAVVAEGKIDEAQELR
jgi:signal peptidase I